VTHVRFAFGFGPDALPVGGGVTIAPIPDECLNLKAGAKVPPECPQPQEPQQFDGMPEVEVFDRTGHGAWHRLPHPTHGQTYDLADSARFCDPTTGTLLVRYVNFSQDQVGFAVDVSIEGSVQ